MDTPHKFDGLQYAIKSLLHFWQVGLAVMLGIITGTAVLTGALIVGDSVRGSLKRLTIERLGKIDEILLADHFFSTELVDQLRADPNALAGFEEAQGAVLFGQASVEHPGNEQTHRAANVTVIGSTETFWQLSSDETRPDRHPTGREIVLNQPLADRLHARIGDRLILRLAKDQAIAADSTLADKSDLTRSLAELEVIAIIPAEGLGRFSLQANQATPLNAFLPLNTLQQALDRPDQINAVLFAGARADRAPDAESVERLRAAIRPSLTDAGLNLTLVERKYWDEKNDSQQDAYTYFSLSTDRMVFSEKAHDAIVQSLSEFDVQPVMTYLANSISPDADVEASRVIPYSTITAVDSNATLGPLIDDAGTPIVPLEDDEIVLNSWAANDLQVGVGDKIRVSYFNPETTHGEATDTTKTFTLRAIVPLTAPLLPYSEKSPARFVKPPSAATDPDLTPSVPGITDQASIDEWDPPFPFDYRRIRKPKDEDYWDNYRTTPKAFLSLGTGQHIWHSRFGQTTSFRLPATGAISEEKLRQQIGQVIHDQLEQFGFLLLHVKSDGLQASAGTTPFNLLFLGFSLFIIASAIMLVALLSRLAVEQRGRNAGLLLAVGLSRRDVIRLFLYEGLGISVVGAVIGGLLGIGYASLMLVGLKTWWVEAIVTPFLQLVINPWSLILGIVGGAAVSIITLVTTLMGLRRISVRRLLSGNVTEDVIVGDRRRVWRYAPAALFLISIILAILATSLGGEAQAGAFFGSGAAVLIGALTWVAQRLRNTIGGGDQPIPLSTAQLVVRNVGRNPRRSTLTIGLMAAACFLIVAISAFRLSPTTQGTGGFQLIGQTDLAVFDDLNDPIIRQDVIGSDHEALTDATIFAFRLQDGDDASCRNLYQSQRPRVIGCPSGFVDHFDDSQAASFGWAATAALPDATVENPWRLLQGDRDGAIPVVLDKNTAMYSLHLYGGVGERFEIDYGAAGTVEFEVVGLLSNTILQGTLLVSENNLLQLFPSVSGYRYFLIQCPPNRIEDVQRVLEETYSDQGWIATQSKDVLQNLLAVQNTYLSTFQSLGGLGLLLGTFGLAAVQLRNVFERKHELALLQAVGFARYRLAAIVLGEHLLLLASGLGIGLLAALIAVLPHAWAGGAEPPWSTLFSVLIMLLVVGIATGALAMYRVVTAPTLESLRDE